MAQGVSGETLKQAFSDFQTFRKAGKIVVDYSLLSSIVMHFTARNNAKRHEIQEYYLRSLVAPLNRWMPVYGIDTAIRAAHFLSQACCETFQFTAITETPRNGGKEYEGNRLGQRLSNTQPGDGPRFIGRGLLHLTGRGNYSEIGRRIGVDIEKDPASVGSDLDLSVRTACEYWRMRSINIYADKDDFNTVMRLINGGHNGRDERLKALGRAKKSLGIV